MGTASSKFDETNWVSADGGILTAFQTLDGSKPVEKYQTFDVVKVHHREFEVRNGGGEGNLSQDGVIWYKTKKVNGTMMWFDILDKTGEIPLFRATASAMLGEWKILAFQPTFEGQAPNAKASEEAGGVRLYNKAKVTLNGARSLATICLYSKPANGEDAPMGTLNEAEPLLKVDAMVKLLGSAKYQSFLPTTSGDKKSLVGFWSWKNTAKAHKMELHLAKHTDLVLHVILAVLTNLVMEGAAGGTSGGVIAGAAS